MMFIKKFRNTSLAAGPDPGFELTVADTLFTRFMGLMFKTGLPPGQGMLIKNCNWVHTFCMRFSIDVLYLDAGFTVVAIKHLAPFRLSLPVPGAVQVVELKAGSAGHHGIAAGDRLVTG